jgi:pyruvate dehydrogenase E2 component (dihydrolipoamide acetyltransferase)
MATPVIMPRQGQSVESCIITQWYKAKGENVSEGDILFSYETDKAAFDEEAKSSGIILDIFFAEGDEVPVLENVAVIGSKGEDSDQFRPGKAGKQQSSEPIGKKTSSESTSPSVAQTPLISVEADSKQRISPLARKLSKQMGINTNDIKGSGPNGRIVKSDIELAFQDKPFTKTSSADSKNKEFQSAPIYTASTSYKTEKISNMRKIIAQKMHESLQNSAQLTHHLSADARKMLMIRKSVKENLQKQKDSVDITINDLVCYAVVKALKNHPNMNAHFMGDHINTFNNVHLGIAVDTPRGLMVPALQNADMLNLQGLANQLKSLALSCKDGSVQPDLLSSSAASFTISNLGAFGIEMFTPVLNLPQIGILGVNTITHRPLDLGDGTIGFVPHIGLSLTYDHRAVDGAPASAFLKEIKNQIENLSGDIV